MNIAIDTNCIIPGKVGGIEQYTLGLIEAIKLPDSPASRIILLTRPENHAMFLNLQDAHTTTVLIDRPEYQGIAVANWAELHRDNPAAGARLSGEFQKRKREMLYRHSVDLVHFPGNTINPLDLDLPVVLNLHDIQFRHFPEYYTADELDHREKFWVQSAHRADAMIVGSDYIRGDLQVQLKLGPEKMFMTPEPFMAAFCEKPSQGQLDDLRRRMKLPETFFLYPAVPWDHKNHRRLIPAFLEANIPGAQLILTGGGQEESFLPSFISDLGVSEEIRLIGRVSTEDLLGLYHLATGMVFPSEFEAWSIPIMEAMACGCPVASSNATSLGQEVGDAGLLFEPTDIEGMARAMRSLATDAGLRKTLSDRGRERVKDFGPEEFNRTLARAYVYARSAHSLRKAA